MKLLNKLLIFLICSTIALSSCTTSKTITTITQDSTRVLTKVDTLVELVMDTVKFNNLLNEHLLLEKEIDSLNKIEPITLIQKDKKDSALYQLYKKRYKNQQILYKGAIKDSTYIIKDSLVISNNDTTYTQPIQFIISKKENNIELFFNNEIKVLTKETIKETNINRKITFFNWIKSKFTLFLIVVIIIILFILKIFRFI